MVVTLEIVPEVVEVEVALAAPLVPDALEDVDTVGLADSARQNLTPCAGILTPLTLVV